MSIDPTRITTIKASEISISNVNDRIEVNGHGGYLLAYGPSGGIGALSHTLILGPNQMPRSINARANDEVHILDMDKPRNPVAHWGV